MVKMVEVNIEEYYNQYKEIIKTCKKEGVLLPYLLEIIEVPTEYKYSQRELDELPFAGERFMDSLVNKRKDERDHIRKYDFSKKKDRSNYEKSLTRKHNKELKDFTNKYSQFQKIIK